jgi:lysozyme
MPDFAKGIDVSHHRGDIAWSEVRASGVVFAFAKATEGAAFVDPRFSQNWMQMRAAGLLRGAYHFFRPDVDPLAQARHFVDTTWPFVHDFDLPPVLDVENSPSFVREAFQKMTIQRRIAAVKTWLEEVYRRTGRTAILYTNPDTWSATLGDTTSFGRHPIWIAHYGVSSPLVPAKNWLGAGWTIWQFTDRGQIPGVNSGQPPVDVNVFRGDARQLLDWMGLAEIPRFVQGLTNSQALLAFRVVAEKHDVRLASLLTSVKMSYLAEARFAGLGYDGAAPHDLALPPSLADSLATQFDLILAEGSPGTSTYPLHALTNQQVINGFYRAAQRLEMGGWALLQVAGLGGLTLARSATYSGPRLAELATLSPDQIAVLNRVFDLADADRGGEVAEVPHPGVTHQMLINAVYKLAGVRGVPGWTLLTRFGLTRLAADRGALYRGTAVSDLAGASEEDRRYLAQVLGLNYDPPPAAQATYPGLSNQDMINVFYRAGRLLGRPGWGLLAAAGLAHLAQSAETRNSPYTGLRVEDISGLGEPEREALLGAMTG